MKPAINHIAVPAIAKIPSDREVPPPAKLRYTIVAIMTALAAKHAIGTTLRFSIELRSLVNAIRAMMFVTPYSRKVPKFDSNVIEVRFVTVSTPKDPMAAATAAIIQIPIAGVEYFGFSLLRG